MKLVNFARDGQARLGVMVTHNGRERVLDLSLALPGLPTHMVQFLNVGDQALPAAAAAARKCDERFLAPAAGVTLLAPLPKPGKLLCVGHNYFDHMGAGQTAPPDYPTFFCKTTNTVIGPGQAIIVPRSTDQVDYEAELAVVIGKRCRSVTPEEALAFVAGYSIFNDVSARDFQKRTSQWMIGKSFDTFGPMGPALVTADEIPDPQQLELWLTLNGLELQRTNTRNMIFSVPYLIAYLSEVMTLEPGDLISTGTPAKTELARAIPPFMKPGDLVSIHIQGIGELANPIVAQA